MKFETNKEKGNTSVINMKNIELNKKASKMEAFFARVVDQLNLEKLRFPKCVPAIFEISDH